MAMTRKDISRLLKEQGGRSPEEACMIGHVIYHGVLPYICNSKNEVLKVAGTMRIEHRPPSPRDDRAYWTVQSPFTQDWYLFVQNRETLEFPHRHHYISNERPTQFVD